MLWTRPGIAALVALGLSACGSDYDNCPPAGTYVTMATRSADPGDCRHRDGDSDGDFLR